MAGFIFGGNTGLTYEQIQRQRKLADAITAQLSGSKPKTAREGIGAVLSGIGAGFARRQADKSEDAQTGPAKAFAEQLLTGSPLGGAAPSMASRASATAPMAAAGGSGSYRDAIASIESAGSGDYAAVGPTHPKLGRALGRYQIMEANIGPWSKAALGREVTPEEFMANPQLQDAIFDNQFNGYVQKYGPEGAAQAWLGGEGGVGKTGRKDSLGTSVGAYGQRFMNALGPQVASTDPSIGMPPQTAAQAIEAQAPQQMPPMEPPPQEMAQAAPQPAMPAPQQQAPGGVDPRLLQALANPFTPPELKQSLELLARQQMQQAQAQQEMQMKQADPAYQVELERSRLALEAMKNPKPEYDIISGKDGSIFRADKQAGTVEQVYGGKPDVFRPLTNDEEVKFGLDPSFAYQIGPDNKISKIGGEGTTVNIDQRAEGAFDKKLAEKQAETFDTMAAEGINARADLGVINELDGLLKGQGGTLTGMSGVLAKYGIGGDGVDDLQAAQALINKLIPSQRAPGSGSMSDRDVEMFTRSLPSLWNTPGGNEKIINVMRGLTEYKQQQGEIADQVITGEMTRQEARRALRAIPNPLEGFKAPEKPAVPMGENGLPDLSRMSDEELRSLLNEQ